MVRRAVSAAVLATVSFGILAPAAARGDEPPPTAPAVTACRAHERELPSVPGAVVAGPAACRTVEVVGRGLARVGARDLGEYEQSWVHRALSLQRELDAAAPLFEAVVPHTHNTFNSSAYDATLTNLDPNQAYSITDQLRMDMRLIELDLHWVPSRHGTAETGGQWVTLCHGNSSADPRVHLGCSDDRPFQDGLAEVAAWLRANPGQFVIVYLENQLSEDASGHALAARLIDDALGGLVEKPATPCADMDWSRDRASMLAAGHRVLFVGDCGAGAGNGWGATVFQRGSRWDESGDPSDYPGGCQRDQQKHVTGHKFVRYFEDSTWLSAMVDSNAVTTSLGGSTSISPEQAAEMVACGVNIVGLDQLGPADPRLAALVWSWAPDEPRAGAGDCAAQASDGRFRARQCDGVRPAACLETAQGWRVTAAAVPFDRGAPACAAEFPGTTFAVPVNGLRNRQLVAAKGSVGEVWVHERLGPAPPAVAASAALTVASVATPRSAPAPSGIGPRSGAQPAQRAGAPAGVGRDQTTAVRARSASSRSGDAPALRWAAVMALLAAIGSTALVRRRR